MDAVILDLSLPDRGGLARLWLSGAARGSVVTLPLTNEDD
jgi:hypothetical protein